jgi:hypothetical protein
LVQATGDYINFPVGLLVSCLLCSKFGENLMSACSSSARTLPWGSSSDGCIKLSSLEFTTSPALSNCSLLRSFLLIHQWIESPSLYGIFSESHTYFLLVIYLFSDCSSVPVVLLLVFVVCGVTLGVVSVLFCLFCSSICCLCGDFSGFLGYDRAMFVT